MQQVRYFIARVTPAQAFRFAVMVAVIGVASSALALASGSGISQLDSGFTTAINIGRVIAAIVALALLVGLIAEWMGHKNLGKMFLEFLGMAVCAIFATNPTTILGLFGVSGATLHAVTTTALHVLVR